MRFVGVLGLRFLVCVCVSLCLPAMAMSGTSEMASKAALQAKGYGFDQPSYTRAVTERDYEAIELFLKAGMPPGTYDELDEFSAMTPMAVALYENDQTLFHLLIKYGDAPSMEECGYAFGQNTPLAFEVAQVCLRSSMDFTTYPHGMYCNDDPRMKKLLEKNLKPVHWATALGEYYIIRMVNDADFMLLGRLELSDTGNTTIVFKDKGVNVIRYMTTTPYYVFGQNLFIPSGWDSRVIEGPLEFRFLAYDYLGGRAIYTTDQAPDLRLVKRKDGERDWYAYSGAIEDLQFP